MAAYVEPILVQYWAPINIVLLVTNIDPRLDQYLGPILGSNIGCQYWSNIGVLARVCGEITSLPGHPDLKISAIPHSNSLIHLPSVTLSLP